MMTFVFRTAISPAILMTALVPFADAAGPFDGAYAGTTKLVRQNSRPGAGSSSCAGSGAGTTGTRTVADGTIKLSLLGSDWTVTVGADGTISGATTVGQSRLEATGKITGKNMVLNWGSPWCGYQFEGAKG